MGFHGRSPVSTSVKIIVRSRKVSNSWGWVLKFSYRVAIWQALWKKLISRLRDFARSYVLFHIGSDPWFIIGNWISNKLSENQGGHKYHFFSQSLKVIIINTFTSEYLSRYHECTYLDCRKTPYIPLYADDPQIFPVRICTSHIPIYIYKCYDQHKAETVVNYFNIYIYVYIYIV